MFLPIEYASGDNIQDQIFDDFALTKKIIGNKSE